MNFIIFVYILFMAMLISQINGYSYDKYNGHNPYMNDKTRYSFKRYDNLDVNTHFIEPTNDPSINEYILNKKLISEPIKIDDDDVLIVLPLKYYDKYSFKDNWANSWRDSDVW